MKPPMKNARRGSAVCGAGSMEVVRGLQTELEEAVKVGLYVECTKQFANLSSMRKICKSKQHFVEHDSFLASSHPYDFLKSIATSQIAES